MARTRYKARQISAPFKQDPDTVYLFTDGSAAKTWGVWVGGWAVVMLYRNHLLEISGGVAGATVNEMELTAIHEGLLSLRTQDKPVIVFSDSQYAVNCVTAWCHKWRKAGWVTGSGLPVQNADLIRAIYDLRQDNVSYRWIKGHSDHPHNDRADALATEARKKEQARIMGIVQVNGDTGPRVVSPKECGPGIYVGGSPDEKGHVVIVKNRSVIVLTPEEAKAVGYEAVYRTSPETAGAHPVDLYSPHLAKAIERTIASPEPVQAPPTPRKRFRPPVAQRDPNE